MAKNWRQDSSGNSPQDWEIFEVLCDIKTRPAKPFKENIIIDSTCGNTTVTLTDHHHNIDLVTTLRSELAALSYKRDRLSSELAETKTTLCSRESECENLRAQAARQSALISSLQGRLQAAENREQSVQSRCDSTIQTIQREKRESDDRNKELVCKIQHLESHLANEESQKEQVKTQLHDLLRRLSLCLGMEVCENTPHLSVECVVTRAEEVMAELQRAKLKVSSTCDALGSCENELMNMKSLANIEKQRLCAQLEASTNHNHELEGRCRQYERDLQIQRDRLTEAEISTEKLKEELRGFESRCHRLQSNLDRAQNDRMQFLRCVATQLDLPEPCETLIKDKIREILNDNHTMHSQIHNLRTELSAEHEKLKDNQETSECRIRDEEAQKCELEERLEKCHAEIHALRHDHLGLSEYLQRLARALNWSECSAPPALGTDTNLMAESLLERAERLAAHEHHSHEAISHSHHHHHRLDHTPEKGCCDHHHHHSTPSHLKLRRSSSGHDITVKESTSIYNLQRRVRILREQVQRRDMHLELLRRKLAIIEDGARGKCILQSERDDAVCRAKKASKQIDKLTTQLADARSQICEMKAQLAEAVEYKLTALERARKIDDLTGQICDLEEQKGHLISQLNATKEHLKSATESAQNRRCRDEALIASLREDLNRLQTQLSDANHRLSHLQSFRTSVARTLHLRDLPETDLLHRLQALCSAHQEFTLLSKRYEDASPIGESCPRLEEHLPPPCKPLHEVNAVTSSPFHHHHRSALTTGHGHGHDTHAEAALHTHHTHNTHTRSHSHSHNKHNHNVNNNVNNHNHYRHRSKSRDKRLHHDECFESDVHRHHRSCKEELVVSDTCHDDFDFKAKYC